MPFYTVYILMGRWDLGPLLCDLWLSVDYTVCLVSQYTVLLITIDRFCSVKIAASYRSWRTKTRVIYMVTITWIIPALLFFISIFGWEHFTGKRDLKPGECVVQFLKDPVFNTALIIGYYWTTLVVLFVLYGGIYKTAYDMQKRSEAKQRRMQNMVALSAGAMSGMVERAAGLGMSSSPNRKQVPISNENFTAQVSSTLPLSQMTSSTSSNQVGDIQQKRDQIRKKSKDKLPIKPKKNGNNDVLNKESSTEIEKSERSSSPAFDSDEDNSSANQLNLQQAQVILLKKRSSMGLVFSAQAAILATKSNQTNVNTKSIPDPKPSSILKTPRVQYASNTNTVNLNLLDDHSKQMEIDQFEPIQPTPIQNPISPIDIEPIDVPKDQAQVYFSHTILPPPDGFRGSPSIKSESPPSKSDRSDLFTKSDLTYDILGGMDGADLRYMDESSLAITSPFNEGPSSTIHSTFPQQNNNLNNQNSVNPTLLQKALIRAAKSQQPSTIPCVSTSTKAFLNETDIQIHSSIFNTDLLEANLPPPPPPRSISSTIPLNKFDITVTLAKEKSSDKPVTSIVPANNSNIDEIQQYPSSSAKSTVVVQSLTDAINTTSSLITPDAKPSTTSSTASTLQTQTKVSSGDQEFICRSSSSRRDFIKSIGKKIKGGRKKLPLVGRTKSKSENRARKAFRTISFILGCFVMCWTPYHVIALVEGFCRNPPCINPHLFMFSYFLCYANSPMNPFCYALANQQFKKTFTRLLKGDFHMT